MRFAVAHHNPASCKRWRDALASELPDAEVFIWSEDDPREADYAIAWSAPPRAFFTRNSRLRAFFSTGAGVEKLLASPDLPPHIPVIRLEDAGMAAQMVSYCVGAVLHWMRQRDEYAELQRARTWQQLPAEDIANWPIGVFGLGVLGRQVASAFAALGFTVNGYARTAHSLAGIRCYSESGAPGAGVDAFLAATRVLVILAPLTPHTQNRFDERELAQLMPHSYVINVARGELLVDDALLSLLAAGHIAGATLDVFREEPLPAGHPFWTHPKVSITPHVSAVTLIGPSARQVAEKVRALEDGRQVSGIVERARGY